MVDIFELIRQKCPDGIPMQPIGKVAKICKGHELSRGKLSETKTDETPYPVMNMGTGPSGYWSEANREPGTITISGHGMTSGALNWFDEPFFASDGCYVFEPTDEIMPRYLYYVLLARHRFLINSVKGELIRNLYPGDIARVQVPVPPLQVQREIVAILDKFDAYCNNMTAGLAGELEMRRKQYRYWAEHLVMDGNVEMVELDKLCRINKGTQMNKSDYQDGPYPIYNMGAEPSGTHTEYNRDIPSIVIAGHGNSCGFVNWVDEPFWAGGGCYYLDSLAPDLSNRYLYHAMKVREGFLMGLGSHGPIRDLYPRTIARLQVPVPVSVPGTGAWDIARQQSICETLDKYLTLEHELEYEMEYELELRRKQYEYYRDMLLSFPERKENA